MVLGNIRGRPAGMYLQKNLENHYLISQIKFKYLIFRNGIMSIQAGSSQYTRDQNPGERRNQHENQKLRSQS